MLIGATPHIQMGGLVTLIYVALGGALGAAARYGVSGWVQAAVGAGFPAGTMVVNVAGSFLLGLSFRYLQAIPASPELRALVAIGLLGGFTTFSTFSFESAALLQDGEWGKAAAYALGSLVLGLIAVFVGFWVAAAVLRVRG